MLYFRQIITMLLGLYTVRVVLNTLGVIDYGIYNVVFGISAMFGFLNSTLSVAANRFITYELGNNDFIRLKQTVGAVVTINLILNGIIIILGETVGLWFVLHKLVIPIDRIDIAVFLYQFSLVCTVLQITRIPYIAILMAHEQMNMYAWLEILNVALKLLAVYLLTIINYDTLFMYGLLLLCVNLIITLCYQIYCFKNYHESKTFLCLNYQIIKSMLFFSGMDLYSNLSGIARIQGINILLNMFFGPILNAANGFAIQIQNTVSSFSNNLIMAFRPQVILNYVNKNNDIMIKYLRYAAKYGFILLFLIGLPLFLEMPIIMQIWIKNVPDYTIIFCRMTIIFILLMSFLNPLTMGLHATGKIKISSLFNGSLYLSVIPITYILFKNGLSPIFPFIINIIFITLGIIVNLYILRYYIKEFIIRKYITSVIIPCMIIASISSIIPICIICFMKTGVLRLFIVLVSSVVLTSICTFLFGIDKDIKPIVLEKILNILKIRK